MKYKKQYILIGLILIWVYILNYFYAWIDYGINVTSFEKNNLESYEKLTNNYISKRGEVTDNKIFFRNELKITSNELTKIENIINNETLKWFDYSQNFFSDEKLYSWRISNFNLLNDLFDISEYYFSVNNYLKANEYFSITLKISNYFYQNWFINVYSWDKSIDIYNKFYEKLKPNLSQEQISQLDDLLNYEVNKEIAFDLYLKKLRNEYIKMIDDESYKMPFSSSKEVAYFYINYLDNYIKAWNYDIIDEKPRVYKVFLHKTNFYNQRVVGDINIWVKRFLKAEY